MPVATMCRKLLPFFEQALKQYVNVPSVMLDLCSNRRKINALFGSLPEGSLLVANEVVVHAQIY